MELRKDLTLVDVEYTGKKASLTFIDMELEKSFTVNFNKQSYKDGKFYDDPEKEAKVESWCQDLFCVSFDNLKSCIGMKKDVYHYEKYNSLFEASERVKFRKDQLGEVYQTTVKEIIDDGTAVRIRYEIDGDTYESKMTYGTYVKDMNKWFVDDQKRDKVYERFFDKYGVPIENASELVGHPLMVEVKSAFGENYYGDIKKFPKKK